MEIVTTIIFTIFKKKTESILLKFFITIDSYAYSPPDRSKNRTLLTHRDFYSNFCFCKITTCTLFLTIN